MEIQQWQRERGKNNYLKTKKHHVSVMLLFTKRLLKEN